MSIFFFSWAWEIRCRGRATDSCGTDNNNSLGVMSRLKLVSGSCTEQIRREGVYFINLSFFTYFRNKKTYTKYVFAFDSITCRINSMHIHAHHMCWRIFHSNALFLNLPLLLRLAKCVEWKIENFPCSNGSLALSLHTKTVRWGSKCEQIGTQC